MNTRLSYFTDFLRAFWVFFYVLTASKLYSHNTHFQSQRATREKQKHQTDKHPHYCFHNRPKQRQDRISKLQIHFSVWNMRNLWSYSISEIWSYPTGFKSRDCDLPAWASCFCLRSLLKTTWSSLKITIIESKKINTKTVMAQRGAVTTSLITYTQEIYTQWPLYWVQLYKWRQPRAIQQFCSIIFIFKASLFGLRVYIVRIDVLVG